MNDNLPTRNNLVLLAENAASAIPNARSAAPSAAALQAAERLNRPILRLLDTGEAQLAAGAARVVPTLQPAAAAPWPCELSLDAFKLGRHGTAAVRARLARRSFDERFPAPAGRRLGRVHRGSTVARESNRGSRAGWENPDAFCSISHTLRCAG